MEYNLMEMHSVDLPPDFHPTMSVEGFGVVVVTDGVSSKVYNYMDIFTQIEPNLNVGQVTSIHFDPDTGIMCFGKADGQVALWSEDDPPDITINVLEADAPVTALIGGYVAHGRVVSKLAPAVFGDDDDDSIVNRRFEHRVTVPGNEPVTRMHVFRDSLLCFAGNNIYQYNASTLQNYFANGIGPIEMGSLLCFAHNKYVVYPTGFFELFDYDGEKFNYLAFVEDFNDNDDDVKAVSACAFGNYVAILFDNRLLSISTEMNNTMQQVAEIEVEALGHLCGPYRGHAFNLVTRDKIIRYSLNGQEVSATEGSDSSSDSSNDEDAIEENPSIPLWEQIEGSLWGGEEPPEPPSADSIDEEVGERPEPFSSVRAIAQDFRASLRTQRQQLREMFPDSVEEPSSAAGGRGTKRPASDPHMVKAEVLRLMRSLSKEERIALLEELNAEKCPVCLEGYNNPEDVEKDPVLGECGHTVCKDCEPRLQTPKKCPSCRQRWKPAEFALLLV